MIDRFAAPEALWLLALAPGLILLWRRRRRARLSLPTAPIAAGLAPSWRQRLAWLPAAARLAAACLLIVALARPQDVSGEIRTSRDAVAIQMVVDRSLSMAEEMRYGDETLSRLEVVKRVFAQFVAGDGRSLRGRQGDLIGLIAFARYADTICPLVHAHDALLDLVDGLVVERIRSESGTAIGDAMALGAARLKRAEEDLRGRSDEVIDASTTFDSKIMIVLTDGRNNAGQIAPEQAAALAAEWGIRIYTIGIGSPGGEEPGFLGIMRPDREVDEATLRSVAQGAGGRYFLASDADTLRDVYAEIDRLEKTQVESIEYTEVDEHFAPVAMAALGALLADLLLRITVLRRLP
ncbi:MAG: VWA domain-containing protein [Phycisphaerales bacterium JB039]